MTRRSDTPRYIIVLGTNYSGSGAVFDYLSGRGDLYDPLAGSEYLLPQAPHGLMELESAAGLAFNPAVSDHAVDRFLELAKKLARNPLPWSYGRGYLKFLESFYINVEKFVEEAAVAKMPMCMHWRVSERRVIEGLLAKALNAARFKETAKKTFLLVDAPTLVEKSRLMHDRIFLQAASGRTVLMNQAGSGWNPVESTKYFGDRKVVLVTRDPRDQFAELKTHKKACNVDEFVNWFRQLEYRTKELDDSIVLRVRFEDFVYEYDFKVDEICGFLGIAGDVESKYRPEDSEKNIGQYGLVLNREEVFKIEQNLSCYSG